MKQPIVILLITILTLGLLFNSCSKSPQPIDYGNDACSYCQMTIVDKIHGAELITDKGKVFKFDAAECLIRYAKELDHTEGYVLLTNHFENPEELVSVETVTFLISENLPSPMGAFLTAFKTETTALAIKKEKGGELFDWKELQNHIK